MVKTSAEPEYKSIVLCHEDKKSGSQIGPVFNFVLFYYFSIHDTPPPLPGINVQIEHISQLMVYI
jgi:hypothetical protein